MELVLDEVLWRQNGEEALHFLELEIAEILCWYTILRLIPSLHTYKVHQPEGSWLQVNYTSSHQAENS